MLSMRASLSLAALASAAAQTLPIAALPGLASNPAFKMFGGYVNYYSTGNSNENLRPRDEISCEESHDDSFCVI